ncbi:MAG TPA: GNAT family N-acetyltransferase [Ilumatobacteraceae bacterium]|nr:GNAT family N-acetyltransferase [Ilumatobacteraceae bacterium]
MQEHVTTLRRFNRSFTQRIGALDESFLGSGRPLGPSRLLYEIGTEGIGVLQLRRRLGLDSGYVSRLLRQLESAGLVAVTAEPHDGRRRRARLTRRGIREWKRLDRRSDALAERLVSPLSVRQREQLSEALGTAERLLRAATISLDVVDPRSDEALWAMTQYFDELDRRFTAGFDPGNTLVADAPSMSAPQGVFVVAHSDGEVVACGGVKRIDDDRAEIKRMWVRESARGLGVGRRLLQHLEEQAIRLGCSWVVLDTNATLLEAIAMYERAGYSPIERYNDNPYAARWFAKELRPGPM